MLLQLRRRVTFANVISIVALFVALGSTATAAGVLGFGSIRSHHLAVNSVSSVKVKNASLEVRDLSPTARQELRGAQGPAGPTGAAGPVGVGAPMSFATVAGTFATTDITYVDGGGPRVSVTVVPRTSGAATGFVQVWAQATIDVDGGAAALYDVTGPPTLVAGQSQIPLCAPDPFLLHGDGTGGPTVSSTSQAFSASGCSSSGPPAAVIFELPVGVRQLELRYLNCGCGANPVSFSQRSLWVAPMGASS
jgi:hypothetical protein